MKNKQFLLFVLICTLLVSSACDLVESQPPSDGPTSAVYATAITAGGTHDLGDSSYACALLNNGKVKCWGGNESGQLGWVDGTYTSHSAPIEVPELADVIAISAGGGHMCALIRTGEVKCLGQNGSGELGDGTTDSTTTPVYVSGLTDAISVSAGTSHTCAITKDGNANCWGNNLRGSVGDGSDIGTILKPVKVTGLNKNILSLSAGNDYTCAVTDQGGVKCWGLNNCGQIGNSNDEVDDRRPADVVALNSKIKSISTSFATTCAVTENNSVLCWGRTGAAQGCTASPQEMDGLDKNIIEVAMGTQHICGLTNAGVVKCLGNNNHGQLGNGTTKDASSAQNVRGLGKVIAITARLNFTCALISNGKVFCWGQNESGQLGNGTNTDSSKPVEVIDLVE